MSSNTNNSPRNDSFFLPDFCSVRMVFAVVIISELLAILLTLAPSVHSGSRWTELSQISLFVQWVGLSSAGLLCLSRRWLASLSDTMAATASYLMLLVNTLLLTEIAGWVDSYANMTRWQPALLNLGEWQGELLLRNLGISAIVSAAVLRYFYVQHQWKQNMRAEAQARLQALQARIRPHFLFNALNTIASLTQTDADRAETAVEDLADLFRNSMADATHYATLRDEIQLTRRYLDIEKLRLGDRVDIHWRMDELPDDAMVPRLILQPLLENAIYHGIEPRNDGGSIGIHGHRYDDEIYITISNPLPPCADTAQREGNRIAQDNVRQRLAAIYGERGRLLVQEDQQDYITTLILPYQREQAETNDR